VFFFCVVFFWGDVILNFFIRGFQLFSPSPTNRLTWTVQPNPGCKKVPRAALFGPQTDIHKPLALPTDTLRRPDGDIFFAAALEGEEIYGASLLTALDFFGTFFLVIPLTDPWDW